jgi:hypothetical protein
MHMRNQLSSDGTLRTWRWPAGLGESYIGDQVHMTIEHVHLSVERVVQLQRLEERVKISDIKIQKNIHGANQHKGSLKNNFGKDPSGSMLEAYKNAQKVASKKNQRGKNNG